MARSETVQSRYRVVQSRANLLKSLNIGKVYRVPPRNTPSVLLAHKSERADDLHGDRNGKNVSLQMQT
jgi:hypothetical protein